MDGGVRRNRRSISGANRRHGVVPAVLGGGRLARSGDVQLRQWRLLCVARLSRLANQQRMARALFHVPAHTRCLNCCLLTETINRQGPRAQEVRHREADQERLPQARPQVSPRGWCLARNGVLLLATLQTTPAMQQRQPGIVFLNHCLLYLHARDHTTLRLMQVPPRQEPG